MKQTNFNVKSEYLMKLFGLNQKSNSRCIIVACISLLMITSGALIMHYDPISLWMDSQLQMGPGTLLFKFFESPPLEIIFSVYVFNVTNPEAFLAGKEKIKVEEVGPYVYQEEIKNVDRRFNDNGTMTFTTRRYLKFRKDLSIGEDKVDKIISSNIPLLGISTFIKDKSMMTNMIVAQLANILNSKPFLELTIDEYLWGYDDKLVTLAHSALPNWINFPRFGILDRMMALDNASNTVTIKIDDRPIQSAILKGEDAKSPYTVMNFNGSPGLPHWGYEEVPRNETNPHNTRCNSIEGVYESGLFDTRYVNENTSVWFYRRAFCRPLPMEYVGHTKVGNIDAVELTMKPNFLDLPADNPDNECYCNKPGAMCKRRGIGYLTPCYYGIPVTISLPHFLNSDPTLLEAIDGLHPDPEKHLTHLAISERMGFPVSASLRIQINLEVDTRLSSRCQPFNGLMLPLFWVELSANNLHWFFYVLDFAIKYIIPVASGLLSWLLLIFGCAIAASVALLALYAPRGHGFEDPYDNKIGYSPIRIIPVGVYHAPSIRIS